MKLGIVTDTHLAPPDAPPAKHINPYDFMNQRRRFVAALDHFRSTGVDAIVHLGDLTNGPDAVIAEEGLDLLAATGLPVWLIAGNHDVEDGAATHAARIAARSGRGLSTPEHPGLEIDGVRIAALSGIDTGDRLRWNVTVPDVSGWLDRPLLLFCHYPLRSMRQEVNAAGFKYSGDILAIEQTTASVLGRPGPSIVVHGHLHARVELADRGLLQLGCASIIEPPHEFAVLAVDHLDGALDVRVERFPELGDDAAFPVIAPVRSHWQWSGGAWSRLDGPGA